jgi:tetratricopeptide repeat protein
MESAPTDISGLLRTALAALEAGDSVRAESVFRSIVELEPLQAPARQGLGKALVDQLRLEEAEAVFHAAAEVDPVPALARYHVGLCRLLRGDYANGWDGWEQRLDVPAFRHLQVNLPRWTVNRRPVGRLLVVADQGYGDIIQFSRFLPRLTAQPRVSVTFLCPTPLLSLYRSWAGYSGLTMSDSVRVTDHDSFVAVGSLAAILRVGAGDLPGELPAFGVDPGNVERWRAARPRAQCVAGLCWAGRPTHPQDRSRSISPEHLLALRDIPGLALVGLQRPPCTRVPPPGLLDADWGAEIRDFSDLAAMLLALDVVVTVDTATAHLAGTLGRPTHVMLPYAPDWRWLLGRNDSPWYPSVRLFRQPRPGDWTSAIGRVVEALA